MTMLPPACWISGASPANPSVSGSRSWLRYVESSAPIGLQRSPARKACVEGWVTNDPIGSEARHYLLFSFTPLGTW